MNDVNLLKDLGARYARCVDQRDFDNLSDIFETDATLTMYFGPPETTEPVFKVNGVAEIANAFQVLRRYEKTFHFVGQQLITDITANSANGETYCIAYHFHSAGTYVMFIRYQDKYVFDEGAWKIQQRTLFVDRAEGQDFDS